MTVLLGAGNGWWGGGGAGHRPGTTEKPAGIHVTPATGLMQNGALTVIKQAVGKGGVYVVGRAGPDRMLLRCHGTHDPCLELQNIAWSADGTKIALGVTSYGMPSSYDGLHVVDLATGHDRQLTGDANRAGLMADPAWSPDGRWLAFEARDPGMISLATADGSHHAILRTGALGWARYPTWSPDGTRIAFQAGPLGGCGIGPFGVESCEIYVVRLDGTHLRRLARHGSSPVWSPLGTTIAYQASCGIRLVVPTGGDVTPSGVDVTPSSIGHCRHIGLPGQPVWSPDGRKIAFEHPTRNGTRGLYVMNADGTHLVHVTRTTGFTAAGVGRAAWRPRQAPQ